jgi:hypothetical protein
MLEELHFEQPVRRSMQGTHLFVEGLTVTVLFTQDVQTVIELQVKQSTIATEHRGHALELKA